MSTELKITSTTNPAYNDTSNAFFWIDEGIALHVTVPDGGESWAAGSTHPVTWEYNNISAPVVQIELWKGGVRNQIIQTSAPMGSNGRGSYNWTIPLTQISGTGYSVTVWSNPGGYMDRSDAPFTITPPSPGSITVTSPDGGETWQRGTPHTVTWSYTGSPGSLVKITLLKAGAEVGTITRQHINRQWWNRFLHMADINQPAERQAVITRSKSRA